MSRKAFCEKLGYTFKNEELLETALTHSSYIKDMDMTPDMSNERLEFLGDAILDAVTAKMLFDRLPEASEGAMTKYRAMIVKGKSLAAIGQGLDIGSELKLGRGEEMYGGRSRVSNLENAMEALIAAVFLDGGYEAAQKFIERQFSEKIEKVLSGKPPEDHKSALQEKLQASGPVSIKYETVREEGPEHDKTFYVRVIVDVSECGRGSGKSKKEAEQQAAGMALESLE